MTKYYDVTLTNRKRNNKVSYLTNSFSVNDDRILTIKSVDCGYVVIKIERDEELSVNEIELKDW